MLSAILRGSMAGCDRAGINHDNPTNPRRAAARRSTGRTLGILMLETEFPRVHGDVGNAATFPFPVLYKVVPGATAYSVVKQKGAGLHNVFIDAARELVQIGADGIGTLSPHFSNNA